MSPTRKRRLRVAGLIGLSATALSLALVMPLRADDTSQRATTPVAKAAQTPANTTPALRPARPYWIELTIAQRQALAPLSDDWERLDGQTKKKWVEIGNRYPKMNPDEQQHTQERMREWALLTPEQRRVARDSFARVRAMPPEKRAEMLRKYSELPDEKKKQLTTEGQASKSIVVPKPSTSATTPRRIQMSEGAKVRNPAIAAQKATASRDPKTATVNPVDVIKPWSSGPAPTMTTPVSPAVLPGTVLPATLPAPLPAVSPADKAPQTSPKNDVPQ